MVREDFGKTKAMSSRNVFKKCYSLSPILAILLGVRNLLLKSSFAKIRLLGNYKPSISAKISSKTNALLKNLEVLSLIP
jgi:hypothetical protein